MPLTSRLTAFLLLWPLFGGLVHAASPDQLREQVEFLASQELQGRLAGSPGELQAAEYLAQRLRELGARPLAGEDDLLLSFDFTAGVSDAGSTVRLEGLGEWDTNGHVRALSFSDEGEAEGDVVFAGYGLKVPEGQGLSYDNYFGLDLVGKIALVLRYYPEEADEETRSVLLRYSGLRYKAMHACEAGAKGVLLVTGPRSPNAGELVPMTFDTAISGSGILAASLSGELGERVFAMAGKSLEEAQAAFDSGDPHVQGFPLTGARVALEVAVEREHRQGRNVVGVFPPRDSVGAAKPWLLIGAHYDHLGEGGHGNSLARKGESGQIHRGADDNASGVVSALATAAALAEISSSRGVVVAFWSGEELGLLGSTDFVKQERLALESIVACLNFDMVGRANDNRLVVQGVGSSEAWRGLVEQSNVPVGFDIQLQEDPYLPTDSASFNRVGVPCLNFFTGGHEDYHRPTDVPEKVNYEDMERVVQLATGIGRRLMKLEEPLEFVKVSPKMEQGPARDAVRAFTGTIPDYTIEVEGLMLSGVVGGGPAEEAGLREGDIITRFGDRKITNIYDYTYALEAVEVGVAIEVIFARDGETKETTITPRARP